MLGIGERLVQHLVDQVDRRRREPLLAAGSSSPTTPSWARANKAAFVMVIGLADPALALGDGGLRKVSHLSLSDRVAAA
jgi:hypothetical protein